MPRFYLEKGKGSVTGVLALLSLLPSFPRWDANLGEFSRLQLTEEFNQFNPVILTPLNSLQLTTATPASLAVSSCVFSGHSLAVTCHCDAQLPH